MGAGNNSVVTDLLVIGGGMAGLTAGARAARAGADVVLVERAPALGGSTVFTSYVWTTPTVEAMQAVNPQGDPDLGRALVEGFADGVEWIRSTGTHVGDEQPVLRYGRGYALDANGYIRACERILREAGAEILTGADTTALITDDGVVRGAEVVVDGTSRRIEAISTLLATGGFQADPQLRRQYINPQADLLPLRSNPYSAGTGLKLGQSVGGVFGKADAGFYGHLLTAGVPLSDPKLFRDLGLFYSEHALLFNLNGERFTDETQSDHLTANALSVQPEARGLLIADAVTYREWIDSVYVEGMEPLNSFENARRHNGRVAVAEDLEEFEFMPEEWGYPGAKIRDAIEAFNEAARGGSVTPGREFDLRPLDEPPYYAVEATPAITFTLGGLLIDRDARVRSRDRGTVPGLLAAGADAGGVYVRSYVGGLSSALVFGLAAARTALERSGKRDMSPIQS